MLGLEPTKRRWPGDAPLADSSPRSLALRPLGDFLLGGALLILTLPLMALVALAICCEGCGPIFCREERLGVAGGRIKLVRFRTIRSEAGRAEPTQVGWWLRHTRIDRLPLLINVMRGELSAVGALPGRPNFLDC